MAQKTVAPLSTLIIIGGSAGSLDALMQLLPTLKSGFPFPIVIILHRSNMSDNSLIELLASKTILPVKEADEKDKLSPGCIYLAPPDYHLLVESDGTLSLDMGEKINYSRPSIDVAFTSAAIAYKQQVIAILLSGANADGVQGMQDIKENKGVNIIQDPNQASMPVMPQHAIAAGVNDHIFTVEKIGVFLNELRN